MKIAFLIYLISDNRPIAEVIRPNLLDQRELFNQEFKGMTDQQVTYEDLEQSRLKLIAQIHKNLTSADRTFLLSVKKGDPQWELLNHRTAKHLPGIQWKPYNIQKMSAHKRQAMINVLERKLA